MSSFDGVGSSDGSIQHERGGGACGNGRGWITIHLCRYGSAVVEEDKLGGKAFGIGRASASRQVNKLATHP